MNALFSNFPLEDHEGQGTKIGDYRDHVAAKAPFLVAPLSHHKWACFTPSNFRPLASSMRQ